MQITTHIAECAVRWRAWRAAGERIAFVPTMGNLHAGHISLIELAAQARRPFCRQHFCQSRCSSDLTKISIITRARRMRDERMLREAGCDLMFMPEVGEIYPNGHEFATRVEVPTLSDLLCGEFRPGHFQGVATIVAKLFNIVVPDVAMFGQKDFQQLTVIAADGCRPLPADRNRRRADGA